MIFASQGKFTVSSRVSGFMGYSRPASLRPLAKCQHGTYVPPMDNALQDMIDDFAFLDDWEDRYMHVIEMGKALDALTDTERVDANKVKGCVSQVWLVRDIRDGTPPYLHYRGDSDAHIVKGLVAVTLKLFSGKTPDEILAIDAKAVLSQLGLSEHLSMQRSNGLSSMIATIQDDATRLKAV